MGAHARPLPRLPLASHHLLVPAVVAAAAEPLPASRSPPSFSRQQIMLDNKSHRYEKIEFLGEGQFATVYKSRDIVTDEIVAVKKIKLGSRTEAKDGINRTALREIKILQELSHPHVIKLLDVFGQRSNISLVFDFMQTDLEVVVRESRDDPRQSHLLDLPHIKSYIIMTLKGLRFLHLNWILHRDLKPNNLLIAPNGILKLGDFGLAKAFGSPNRIYTSQVVTRWYRAPELLFGSKMYGPAIDVWAVGCILAELLLRAPLFPGDSDLLQLGKIFEITGTPKEPGERIEGTVWPGVTKLPDFMVFNAIRKQPLGNIFTAADDDLLAVMEYMLSLDPNNRLDCNQLLKQPYFSNLPAPTAPSRLPLPLSGNPAGDVSSFSKRANDLPAYSAKRLQFD